MAQHGRQYDPEDVVFERARQGARGGNGRTDAVLRTREGRRGRRAVWLALVSALIVVAAVIAAMFMLR